MSNDAPGRAVMIAAFCLFGAFTAIAWHEDIARSADHTYEAPRQGSICDELQYELDDQEAINLITAEERATILARCRRMFE